MKLTSLLAVAVAAFPLISAQTCDVNTETLEFETLIDVNLGEQPEEIIKLLPFAEKSGDNVNIVPSSQSGAISGLWFETKARLADGFSAKFDFSISDGNTDGLAFVVQNDKIVNSLSNGGSDLGFSEGVSNYLGVGFDACSDRASGTCNVDQVFIETRVNSGSPVKTTAILSGISLTSGTISVEVQYLLVPSSTVVVLIGGAQVHSANITQLETIFGDKFAFFGFTASNSAIPGSAVVTPATVTVNNLKIVPMNSGFQLDEASLVPKTVDFGKVVSYTVELVDTCNNLLTTGLPANSTEFAQTIRGTLTPKGLDRDPEVVNATPTGNAAIYTLTFTAPNGVEAEWDLEIKVGQVLVQKNPVLGILDTTTPESNGLSPVGIGLLSALIAVLVIGVVSIAIGLHRYRQKLKEHEDDIRLGKEKQEVDRLDKTMSYSMNPMVAPLDKLKERLAHNEKVIEELKAGQRDAIDGDYTVEQLQKQNQDLRNEMNELKKKQEFAGAGNRISAAFTRKLFGGGKKEKLDFDQENA